jgi:hypothetical protein
MRNATLSAVTCDAFVLLHVFKIYIDGNENCCPLSQNVLQQHENNNLYLDERNQPIVRTIS